MKQKEKPKYNMWQNTGFMLCNGWSTCRSVIFICMVLAVVKAGITVAELLIAPAILKKVEMEAPLLELAATIAGFSGVLLILTGLKAYLNENAMYGRISVRLSIVKQICTKMARTSYANILDTRFINLSDKAYQACSANWEPAEQIWTTWREILTNVMGFLVYLALLSRLNGWLIGVIIATAAGGYFFNKHINEWGYRHKEEEASYGQKMEYIRRVATGREQGKDIRIFGLKEWLDQVWDRTLKLYQTFLVKREMVYIWTNVVDLVLALLRNGIAYAYLIHLTLAEELSASSFLLYFSAVSGFTQWITGILDKFLELHKESLDISIIREVLEWPEPFSFEEGEHLAGDLNKAYEIQLQDVSFRYPEAETNTLTRINFTVRPGEKLAIVGVNGAGKTTLMKLICGLLDPTGGRVLLNGQDIRKYNRRDYYALFSAVFQDFSVLEASVAENVAQQVDFFDEEKVRRCLHQAGLTEVVKALPEGIRTKIGRFVFEDGVELSGGQLQRLMLARALYKNGPVLALDEPTAALDPIAENDIYMKYSEMTKGRTSLFISHRLASTRFCDRILFMADGMIAEEGTHESLLALGGGYAKLFETQSRYYKEGDGHDEE